MYNKILSYFLNFVIFMKLWHLYLCTLIEARTLFHFLKKMAHGLKRWKCCPTQTT
jgi:hypothetical protein